MYPFYANTPPRAHPSHYPSPPVNTVQYMQPAPRLAPVLPNPPPSTFESSLKGRLEKANDSFNRAVSQLRLPSGNERQLLDHVEHLRIYKHLFMHTYVHLASCCKRKDLDRLLKYATDWRRWDSVRQLGSHSLIRDSLIELWKGRNCTQHRYLSDQRFVIDDDDNDLLCLLLHCSKKPALHELPRKQAVKARHGNLKESEEVIELLWKFLKKHQGSEDDMRRLRACIYRMARKYAYLPRGLQIRDPCIPNGQSFCGGANGLLTGARLQGRNVVVKKIVSGDRASQRECLEMFASEAILWGTLRHSNIVPFIGVVEEGLDMGLVSPFFRNGNVRHYMSKQDPRQWLALARWLGKGLAEALEYIHFHDPPIIHGDIKADNVLVDDHGNACLADFGQSHALDSGKYLDSTRVGCPKCPFHWMAPEIMQGEHAQSSGKSDIYSFGCVLYEMISGEIPFGGLSETQVRIRVQRGERPSRPKSIPKDHPLWRVAGDCWKPRPEDRPSATKLVRLLEAH